MWSTECKSPRLLVLSSNAQYSSVSVTSIECTTWLRWEQVQVAGNTCVIRWQDVSLRCRLATGPLQTDSRYSPGSHPVHQGLARFLVCTVLLAAGLLAALPPRSGARQLWIPGCRPPGSHAVHRVQAPAPGREAAARRHRQGDSGVPPQLRRINDGALRTARQASPPPHQRVPGHCGEPRAICDLTLLQ